MRIFEYYIKNIVIPDASLDTANIDFKNSVQLTPMSIANNDLPALTIEFIADESLLNYFYLFSFIKKTRFGNISVDSLRHNVINEICVNCMDNQGRILSKLRFKKALPSSVGSMNLEYGASSSNFSSFICL